MKYIKFLLPVLIFASCNGKRDSQENVNSASENITPPEEDVRHKDNVKLEQYVIAGKDLYIQNCSNCHQREGQGLAALYPPLNKSDFMDNNFERVVCIIKNGLQGEITVNGNKFSQVMPANPRLKDLEIAEITTYIYNSWGRNKGMVNVKEVSKILKGCKE